MSNCKFCGKETDNKHFCNHICKVGHKNSSLPNEAIQLAITGIVGDGSLLIRSKYHFYQTAGVKKEYVEFKYNLAKSLIPYTFRCDMNHGYKKNKIFSFSTQSHPQLSYIANDSLQNNLEKLDELGFALWVYDDGSLRQDCYRYTLFTCSINADFQERVILPILEKKFGVIGTIGYERKKDGKIFPNIRFNKTVNDNSDRINTILKKYPLNCYKYKTF